MGQVQVELFDSDCTVGCGGTCGVRPTLSSTDGFRDFSLAYHQILVLVQYLYVLYSYQVYKYDSSTVQSVLVGKKKPKPNCTKLHKY